jgi:hypothetical protein
MRSGRGPRVPNSAFAARRPGQRERRRRWQQAKRASDPDYRDNQARAQRAWAASHGDYRAEYRQRNPAYRDRNRDAARQRQRERRRARMFAKMDAWTVEITVLSKAPPAPGGLQRKDPLAIQGRRR